MKKTISISILDVDIFQLENTLKNLETYNISHIHLDVMDTSFVPNISFGPNILNKILDYNFTFDIHFMLKNPLKILNQLKINEQTRIIYHFEIDEEIKKEIENKYFLTGVAINPESKPEIKNKFVLVMTVNPGFGNQRFIVGSKDKLRMYSGCTVGVDGGINLESAKYVKNADYFVIGSAFFKANDKELFLRKFMEEINE